MASEPADGGTVSAGLPEDLEAWLDERAEERGLEREELVQRLLSAYQVATTASEEEFGPAEGTTPLEERLDRLERDYQQGLDDVRRRVLQLKSVTDEKADADHGHGALDRVETLADRVDERTATTEALADRDGVTREEFDDVEEKLFRVARAVVALRRAADRREEADTVADNDAAPADDADTAAPTGTDATVDPDAASRLLDLKRLAAREGYQTATCGACGESSHVNLLPEPACPACGTPFYDIVEKGRLWKKPTLVGSEGSAE